MIKKGDELFVTVTELNSEGKGVSKLDDGFVIFSSGILPGDEALIKIKKKKSNFAEANPIRIINESPFRVLPRCDYFGVCGGCKLQNYEYFRQAEYKSKVVKDAFERIGGFKNLIVPETLKCDEIYFYRNKMEFSFSDDEWMIVKETESLNKKFALGLHVPKFHSKIINIEKCYLQSELSNNILNLTRDFFKRKNIPVYSTKTQSGFLRFLIIRQSRNTKDLMVNLITYEYNDELMKEYSEQLKNHFPGITTFINSVSEKKAQIATGESENIMFGSGFIYEKLHSAVNVNSDSAKEYLFKISPQSFFQTNTLQAQKLFDVAASYGEFNKEDRVLDLYCGAGTISIFISGIVKNVTGVELIEGAINDAHVNAELNKVSNTKFVCSDIKDFLSDPKSVSEFNKIILDPPRAGLHPKICGILSETKFEKIIYVSCNPHTQARDLQIICSGGNYIIEKIQPVDMFPHTYHIENVVSLKLF